MSARLALSAEMLPACRLNPHAAADSGGIIDSYDEVVKLQTCPDTEQVVLVDGEVLQMSADDMLTVFRIRHVYLRKGLPCGVEGKRTAARRDVDEIKLDLDAGHPSAELEDARFFQIG